MLARVNLIKRRHLIKRVSPIKPIQLINLAQMMLTIRQRALHVSVF
jgi:hypothetical protein